MNDNAPPAPQPKQAAGKQPAERTPIPIEKLLFSVANPHGLKLPDGMDGKNERILPNLTAGIHGEVKIEIDWRPWLRAFRVVKSKRVSRSGTGTAKEVVTWEPMGRPFVIPENLAVAILAED